MSLTPAESPYLTVFLPVLSQLPFSLLSQSFYPSLFSFVATLANSVIG